MRDKAWLGCLLLIGCGRYGFGTVDGDVALGGVAWPDFELASAVETMRGLGPAAQLAISATATGNVVPSYVRNGVPIAFLGSTSVPVADGDTLQFLVDGDLQSSVFFDVRTADGTRIDTVTGTVVTKVSGVGTSDQPYQAPTTSTNCKSFLAIYPEQRDRDGVYQITLGGTLRNVWCDMTTDGGGWTLVARVTSTGTTHVSADAVGVLANPTQPETAKLADADINQMDFSHARIAIDTLGTLYVSISSLDLSGSVSGGASAAVGATLAGPYTEDFMYFPFCRSDCGIGIANNILGYACGYRYYLASGAYTPGMGCAGDYGHGGLVTVR